MTTTISKVWGTSITNTEARNVFVSELQDLMFVIDELVKENHMNENANIKLKNKTKELYDKIENKFNIVQTNNYYHTLSRIVNRNNNSSAMTYGQKTAKGGYSNCNKCGRLIKDGGRDVGRGPNKRFSSFMEQHQQRAVCVNILGQKEGVHKTCGGSEELSKIQVLTHFNNHLLTIATEGMLIHRKRQKDKIKYWKAQIKNDDDYQPDWVKDPDGKWYEVEYVSESDGDDV